MTYATSKTYRVKSPIVIMTEAELINLLRDSDNQIHSLVTRWLNESLIELNQKRENERIEK